MKRKGQHREKQLASTSISKLKQAGRYADGGTLYLEISDSGARSWVQRLVIGGKRVDLGLGSGALVTLKEAREAAYWNRKLAREGKDPRELRRKKESPPLFRIAAIAVHTANLPTWGNERHGIEWLRSLTDYAFPTIGDRTVDNVSIQDVIALLAPMWLNKPETARRVLQRVKAILDWAHAKGYRIAGLDAAAVRKGLPKQQDETEHYAAIPFAQVPAFVASLRTADTAISVRLAFELLILTACRTSEVLLAAPDEFDRDAKMWTIPAIRMKARKAHRVPLSARCVEIVEQSWKLGGEHYLFPGRVKGRPLSNMALLMATRRLVGAACVPHGFRSSFRDWTAEKTNFPNIVAEAALAHTVSDKVEAAYRRTDLFEKRKQLMAAWAQYVTSGKAAVVPMRAQG